MSSAIRSDLSIRWGVPASRTSAPELEAGLELVPRSAHERVEHDLHLEVLGERLVPETYRELEPFAMVPSRRVELAGVDLVRREVVEAPHHVARAAFERQLERAAARLQRGTRVAAVRVGECQVVQCLGLGRTVAMHARDLHGLGRELPRLVGGAAADDRAPTRDHREHSAALGRGTGIRHQLERPIQQHRVRARPLLQSWRSRVTMAIAASSRLPAARSASIAWRSSGVGSPSIPTPHDVASACRSRSSGSGATPGFISRARS